MKKQTLLLAWITAIMVMLTTFGDELPQAFGQPRQDINTQGFMEPMVMSDTTVAQETNASPVEVLSGDNNYFLKVDLQDPRVRIRVGLANNDVGGYETLSSMKNRYAGHGYLEWAIVNGDLFGSGCPSSVNCAQGLTYIDGNHEPNWSVYGNTWEVRGNLGLDASESVEIAVGSHQTKKHMVIAGGPRVVMNGGTPTCSFEFHDGKFLFPASNEWFDNVYSSSTEHWCNSTRAITMVGYSADHRYLYMGISSGGKTVTQLAQWLKDRGAYEILRLDSGSSTGMYHNGSPVGGSYYRAIPNHFAVVVDNTSPPPPPPPATDDWQVTYFNDTSLTEVCNSGSAGGTYVFKDWGDNAAVSGCNADNWSARFWRTVHFEAGMYTFGLGSDDWARLRIGADLVLNNWQGAGQHYASRTFSEGDYEVTVEFADTLGGARVAGWWWGPGYDLPQQERDHSQWYAQYWGNRELWWDSIVRVNEGVDSLEHQWGAGGPGYSLPDDQFSSRFDREVYFACGSYRFDITNDDGVRFWIDGEPVLDKWFDHVGSYTISRNLTTGIHELRLDHYENGGGAQLSIDWSLESTCPGLPGDANGDNKVDGIDYVIWLTHYDQATDSGPQDGDFNFDRRVDGVDYVVWLTNYGTSLPYSTGMTNTVTPQTSAPEPPSNAEISYEVNSAGTAVVVTASWDDNADNEDKFSISWNAEGYGGSTIDTLANPPNIGDREETTSAVLGVIPCQATEQRYSTNAAVQAVNVTSASSAASATGVVTVSACSSIYLPVVNNH